MRDGEWIGVDLDGTLAVYDGWQGPEHIGTPIPAMVERVKQWLAAGHDVRVFTARVSERGGGEHHTSRLAISLWCKEHLGRALPVTNVKDWAMAELWDDRAVAVEANTGRALSPSRRGLT